MAILNRAGGAGAGKGGAKGKGTGGKADNRFPENAMRETKDKEPICIGWNKGSCGHPRCCFKHVCWFCGDETHTGAEHAAKA